MSGIGVVLNPFSKKYKKDPDKLDHMAFIIGDKASCKPTQDIDDLFRVADEFKSRDVDVLAISGGDGTIHHTLSTFIRVYGEKPLPKITLLRGGTMNIVAHTLGVQGKTEKLMSDLLIKYHEDRAFEIRKLRLTQINDKYGFIFAAGIGFRFMEDYYLNPSPNPWIAVKTLLVDGCSAFFNGKNGQRIAERFDAKITVDGQVWPFANYSGIFTGSIRQIGFNFDLFHHMLDQNEKIHAVAVSLMPHDVIRQAVKVKTGNKVKHPGWLETATSEMTIELEKPLGYTIDGEMLGPESKFTIKPGPELTVLV